MAQVLSGTTIKSCEANAVPYRQWRIWMSIAERDRPNGRPLVAFG